MKRLLDREGYINKPVFTVQAIQVDIYIRNIKEKYEA